MQKKISNYWLCQIGGWSAFILLYTFFFFTLNIKEPQNFFKQLFTEAGLGLIVTHVMRSVLKSVKLLQKPIRVQILGLVAATFVFVVIYAVLDIVIEKQLMIQNTNVSKYKFIEVLIRTSFILSLFLIIWNLLYFTYHYVASSQREKVDKIRLEALVKELELKTIKAHINPHFIFNSLNSIRALVDENPTRARTAITELSNILRSSMTSDKVETVTLEKELNIVKDYLALEQIRFEERLQIEIHIDEDTLEQPVPTMMLQTLVENAVKHGISKTISGGKIVIISDYKPHCHELIIRNTGHLNGSMGEEGFGISSTKNRLQLLYGNKAAFYIGDTLNNEVEVKVELPIHS